MDFILDPSLVLYLPLYELDGDSFMSRDAYGRLAIVTGALWTPQGRTFDGVDDLISVADNDAFDPGDFTMSTWTKQNAFAGGYWERAFIAHDTTGGTTNKWLFAHTGSATIFEWVNTWPTSPALTSNAWTLSAGVWYQIGVTRQGSTFTFYKDGVANGTASSAVGLANVAVPLTIGWAEATKKYDGTIGEVLIYNRALTPAEIQNIYLATKWWYQ